MNFKKIADASLKISAQKHSPETCAHYLVALRPKKMSTGIFFYLLFGCPTTSVGPLWDSLTHSMLITAVL